MHGITDKNELFTMRSSDFNLRAHCIPYLQQKHTAKTYPTCPFHGKETITVPRVHIRGQRSRTQGRSRSRSVQGRLKGQAFLRGESLLEKRDLKLPIAKQDFRANTPHQAPLFWHLFVLMIRLSREPYMWRCVTEVMHC